MQYKLFRQEDFENAIKKLILEEISKSKKYIGIKELCAKTGYSNRAIYGMVHQNQIPHYKRGSKLLFDERMIEDWIEEKFVPVKNDDR